jgi:hypothetical protein
MTAVTITIYHNVRGESGSQERAYVDGYKPGDPVTPVFVCAVHRVSRAVSDMALADFVFGVGNKDEDFAGGYERELIRRYRAQRVRSVSKGDVVAVGNRIYSCDSVGWTELPAGSLNVVTFPLSMWDRVSVSGLWDVRVRDLDGVERTSATNLDEASSIEVMRAERKDPFVQGAWRVPAVSPGLTSSIDL